MDMLTVAMRIGSGAVLNEASSALPNAPVVPDTEIATTTHRPRAARTRAVVARGLARAADAIAPAPAYRAAGSTH